VANLLIDISTSSAHAVGGSWADITGMSATVPVVGPSSVVILSFALNPNFPGGDRCAEFRFTEAGSRVGPEVSSFVDRGEGGSGRSMMFAVTGLSAGNHTFAVQAQNRSGVMNMDTGRPRIFQAIELETGASILVDLETTAVDIAQATFTNMVNLSAAVTPTDGALLLFTHGSQIEAIGDDEVGDHRFAIDGTRDGPRAAHAEDAVDETTGVAMAWAVTGVSAALHTLSIQWIDTDGGPAMDTGRVRSFQVIEVTANASLLVDVESLTSEAAPGTYADMDAMTGSPSIDSVDSVVLVMANFTPLPGDNETADLFLTVGGTQDGNEQSVETDDVVEQRSSHCLLPLAVTGEVGTTAFALQWQIREGSPETDTGRERTLQVIDFESPAGNMAGSADMTLTPAASIQADGELAGSAALAITNAAALQALGELLGSTDLVLDMAGTAVGASMISGSADLVITPAAAIQALGRLLGSSALVLTPAGALQAEGQLAGSVALVITPAGAIQATGALAGTTDLALTAAGDLAGRTQIAGAVAMAITPAGAIAATGALAGSAALVLTPAATLQAIGALLGSSALVLTPAGTLGAQGELAGSVALLLTPAATLVGRGDLVGTAALVFTLAGDAKDAPSGALSGTVPLVITATGTMAGLGALAGAATMTITPAGTLVATGGLLGTASLTFTLAGDLSALAAIAGSAGLVLTPAGTLAGLGQLTGGLDLAIDPAGTARAVGGLAGAVPLTLDAAGALLATGALAGSLTMTLTPDATIIATANILGTRATWSVSVRSPAPPIWHSTPTAPCRP